MIQRQYQIIKVLPSSHQTETRLLENIGHNWLRLLISVLLFPSVSLMLVQPTLSAPPIWIQTNPNPLNSEIKEAVQGELDRTYRRTFTALNLLLVLLLVLPTISAGLALLWLSRLGEKIAVAKAEIESLQADASVQLESLIEENQKTLNQLSEQNALAETTLKKLEAQSESRQQNAANTVTLSTDQLVKYYAKQGENLFIEKKYPEALNIYDKALKIKDNLPEVWNNRGVILTKLQRYKEAINSYEKAINIHSDYPDAWNNHGVALGKLQDYEKAIHSYNHAVKLKPDYGDAWNNRGFAFVQLKKYDQAIQSYQQATALKPNSYLIWYNQARCYSLQGQLKLALESLKKATEIKPQAVRKIAQKESDFDRLRSEPNFKALIMK